MWVSESFLFTVLVVVNGAATTFPEVTEETSEWVTAIGGDQQPAYTHSPSCHLTVKYRAVWSAVLFMMCVCVCVCLFRGFLGVLACGEGGGAARGSGGGLSEGAAGGAEGAAGESV